MYTNTVLLSYPRSGNTWLRYCIEYITQHPTGYAEPDHPDRAKFDHPIGSIVGLDVDLANPLILEKTHEPADFDHDRPLVFILRNYKEVIIRFAEITEQVEKPGELINTCMYADNGYMKLLEFFHNYRSRKLLVYYENMINGNLCQVVEDITNFLGMEGDTYKMRMGDFLINHFAHAEKCLNEVYVLNAVSHTQGKKTIHHSDNLTDGQKEMFNQALEKAFPEIFERYLRPYKKA